MPPAATPHIFRGMTAPLLYFEIEPPPDLAPWVRSFWGFEVRGGEPHDHVVWPDGCVSIAWSRTAGASDHPPQLGLAGPTVHAFSVPVAPGDAYRGIRFHPHTGALLVGRDAIRLREVRDWFGGGSERAEDLARRAAAPDAFDTAITVFEQWARRWAPPRTAIDTVVADAAQALERDPASGIGALAARLGLSDRQLRRRFRDATGLSPKEWARIRRMRETLGRVAEGDAGWSTLAAAHGFADQSHLVHELARLTRHTPGQLARRLRLIEHVDVRA